KKEADGLAIHLSNEPQHIPPATNAALQRFEVSARAKNLIIKLGDDGHLLLPDDVDNSVRHVSVTSSARRSSPACVCSSLSALAPRPSPLAPRPSPLINGRGDK